MTRCLLSVDIRRPSHYTLTRAKSPHPEPQNLASLPATEARVFTMLNPIRPFQQLTSSQTSTSDGAMLSFHQPFQTGMSDDALVTFGDATAPGVRPFHDIGSM